MPPGAIGTQKRREVLTLQGMAFVRVLVAAAALAAGAMTVVVACSSFSADSEVTEAGEGEGDGGTAADGARIPTCDTSTIDRDPAHCGTCGHSCLGGACANGLCLPVVVGETTGELVFDLAVDRSNVYWTTANELRNAGHLYACDKTGCTKPTSFGPPFGPTAPGIGSLTGNGSEAYVSFLYAGQGHVAKIDENHTLKRLPPPHNSATRLRLPVAGPLQIFEPYAPSQFDGGTAGGVFAWDGKNETPIARYDVVPTDNLRDFAVANGRVFIGSVDLIRRCAADATSCTVVTSNAGNIIGMASVGPRYFWVQSPGVDLLSCAGDDATCTPQAELGPAQLDGGRPLAVAFEAGRLYVTTSNGMIVECDPANCAGTTRRVAAGQNLYVRNENLLSQSVTADSEAVYWATVDGDIPPDASTSPDGVVHRIMKLAK